MRPANKFARDMTIYGTTVIPHAPYLSRETWSPEVARGSECHAVQNLSHCNRSWKNLEVARYRVILADIELFDYCLWWNNLEYVTVWEKSSDHES